ncbi:hypothetical protein [Arenimonas metalli]|uniref:Uncharacterized protein n=1 Tax=Arenimonas metalli CF5-1 TaxID=1384056 RepID=A0A091ARN4_9GAMM|nr:hypothetical protein [Arenimonas metalli]KFN41996.1 hypothetical protein N787_04310 [Arenimonas metalli CF5-1]
MSPRRQDDPRTRQRRQQLAQEAARLLATGAQHDPARALRKAAERLGIRDEAAFPGGDEIREALEAHQRLFGGDAPPSRRQALREAAQEAMAFFSAFDPRLAGAALEGPVDAHAPVCLHLHADDPDEVAHFLHDQRIPATQVTRRLRLSREQATPLPCWEFEAGGIAFELWVLPASALRQPPLESLEDRPLRRATANALRQLIATGD